jgi:cold shock protein
MYKGKVKFYNDPKIFGYITLENSEEEIYVHASGLIDEIKKNKTVSFEIQEIEGRKTAVNVRVVR